MRENLPHPLCSEVDHWNDVTRLRYHQFLQAITALALEAARRHLAVFSGLLTTSMDFTDRQMDHFADQDNQALQMIKADHLILRRTNTRVQQSLAQLDVAEKISPRSTRSALVDMLDDFVRLKNILDHHVIRVQDSLYPRYHATIKHETGKKLAKQLSTAMQRAGVN